ncbi:hypothetical protein PG996_010005 [Apiospora saccharicola]|uniref:Uncharacterized protein n=1 Tax=Apiospora saccharicola TaxID=335842 RepID=A0ABR1UMB9_9PEZI
MLCAEPFEKQMIQLQEFIDDNRKDKVQTLFFNPDFQNDAWFRALVERHTEEGDAWITPMP